MSNPDTIQINIIVNDEHHLVSTYRNEYRSLMALINDKLYLEGFGDCGGMGRCATCQIHLSNAQNTTARDRNESSTLSKHGITDLSIRLSCQLPMDNMLHNTTVQVTDSC